MSFQVEVNNATNIPNPEKFGKCDPYVAIEFQGLKKKTEVKKGELNPTWNETLEFDLAGRTLTRSDELTVSIFDWERVGRNRLLGITKISLLEFTRGGPVAKPLSVNLEDANKRPTQAVLNIKIKYDPPPEQSKSSAGDTSQGVVVNADDDNETEDDAVEEPNTSGPPELDASGQPVKKPKKTLRRRKYKSLSGKPQDFQIRVKVIKARQLQGANVNPVARVSISNQTRQTRVKKSTSIPSWNESFFFNFHSSPAELFDEFVEFKVFNSKRLRSDALIGSFKFDVGLAYDEPQHALINKWLLLSDPEDAMAGHKGYLKVSVVILGPGDEPPSMKTDEKDEEDVESNLLRPAGLQLRPATFALKVYRAEDIPRMDSAFLEGVKKVFGGGDEKKELVDPYLVFSFAGKEMKTKIVYNCDHPEWNQELKLGLHFPSMCEKMKFMIKDWDRVTEDDIVGTSVLPVSVISASGDLGVPVERSFLPTFGPCYVNFYGSTREYSDLPNEYQDLNEGKGEGVAYRGRVLLELTSELGELENAVTDIENDVLLRVQKYMRRRKYRIHAAFLDATMINAIDAPVEFEISIGNYGNKLDENIPPCASTTQPTNAVFDGCKYYFLPWSGTKPCVVVDCSFEDISFRLEGLNVLLNIIYNLESNIERVRIGIKAKLPMPEIAQLLISLLDQLISDCKTPLPEAEKGVHVDNELDRLMREHRKAELSLISEMALKLRESATDVTEALSEVDSYLQILKTTAVEPQNSMPDVIIWMISGQKRIAYYRIPANEIFFTSSPAYRGRNCGKLQTIQLNTPSSKNKEKNLEIPALLRIKLWLGLQTEENEWHKMQSEGELAVFAETYENQVNVLGTWTNKGPTMTRPKWSDSQGKVELPKEQFVPPPGWRWVSEWYISPELSMLYDKDAGHHTYVEDLYECHSRNIPGGTWGPASRPWADVKGDQMPSRQEMKSPEGWEWQDDWQVDLNRAVDEEGWEYCVEATIGGYGPVEKTYHLCRRRRWMRTRKNVSGTKKQQDKKAQEKQLAKAAEGWEYAALFNMKFHAVERTMDLVRRRRWHRKMVADDPHASCFFNVNPESQDRKDLSMTAPRMFLTFQAPVKYQLRAYIYQARDLLAGDETGLSDPYAQVCFLTQSMVTEKVQKTLCPTWDQTLIFGEIEIYGNPRTLEANPPDIYIELFDYDNFGKPEFLGRTKAQPMVKLDPSDARTPVLQWYDVKRGSQCGGELLAAFELFMLTGKDLPFLPPKRGNLFLVPNGIRPVMQRTAIEVLCWGVRNMKKYQLANVSSPSIQFECGGNALESTVIRDTKKNPNFDNPLLFFDVMLPKEELYMPPMNIRVIDHRNFGRHPTVGVYVLKSMEEFRRDPRRESISDGSRQGGINNGPGTGGDHVVDMSDEDGSKPEFVPGFFGKVGDVVQKVTPKFQKKKNKVIRRKTEPQTSSIFKRKLDFPRFQLPIIQLAGGTEQRAGMPTEEVDWWSKYYASCGETDKCRRYMELGYYKIKVHKTELEKAENYLHFSDFCNTFELSRGKDDDDEDSNSVGEFKGSFRVYPLPQDPSEELPPRILTNLPPSSPVECLVRVYVVSASELQPNDPGGLADPYIEVILGKKTLSSRDNYIPNSIDPVFGRLFEVTAMLPLDKDLVIRVKDYDFVSSDDLIGETCIDLENRYLSRFRATCGIPQHYFISGVNMWRDSQKPKQILEAFCQKNHLSGPMFYSNDSVKVGQRVYNLTDFEKDNTVSKDMGPNEERLALHVLSTLPIVKEHIETRPLFSPLQPGIEQGKLQLWVDIFPKELGPPGPPFDISPRKPKKYVLRCIIRNTVDVILDEESITGEKMSDIYVVGWIASIDNKQKTDVHYRSLNGEGNFNWRFIFPFDYMVAEQTMIVKKKEHFWSLDETELHTDPILMIQIWDNDKFSADDFLGTLQLNLSAMPAPVKRSSACKLSQLADSGPNPAVKTVSLFEAKRLCGFWPCYDDSEGQRVLTGKVEMELELVSVDEADQRPAGKGRDEPNMNPRLEEPKRPATSFLWFASPLKTLRYIIWRNYKWLIIGVLLLALVILLLFLFLYSFPGQVSRWIVGNRS